MDSDLITLGTRLQTVASFIKKGSVLGDIGTDHAYLPVYLVQQGIIERAVGVDIHDGPYHSALETVQAYGLQLAIDIRKGNGLNPIGPGEVNVLVLAGMGGNTILQILAERVDILRGIEELVLQPQGAEGKVRKELMDSGWKLQGERLTEEEGRIYSVIHFSRTEGLTNKDIEDRIKALLDSLGQRGQDDILLENLNKAVWRFGPVIITQKNGLLQRMVRDYMKRLTRVREEIQKSDRKELAGKVQEILEELTLMEVMEQCLFR
ncbi:MAG: tRNA (adenine(22)-N(1))-methyltransferase [Candidatus Dichloromethanomonas elyunquensis]|nr:MAG: tRNA (adenine(22)-N(1))-methyltransferase [Candidatus Dichloromethanomonas elyunquensis]